MTNMEWRAICTERLDSVSDEEIIICLRGLLRLAEEKLKREEQDKQSCS